MSVPVSKRKESELKALTMARTLTAHTIKICSNEKNFPKRYRWCLTSKIVDAAISIFQEIDIANSIYVNSRETAKLRNSHQAEALAKIYNLLSLIQIAYETYNLESSKVEYWTQQTKELREVVRAWKKSDMERFSNFG